MIYLDLMQTQEHPKEDNYDNRNNKIINRG